MQFNKMFEKGNHVLKEQKGKFKVMTLAIMASLLASCNLQINEEAETLSLDGKTLDKAKQEYKDLQLDDETTKNFQDIAETMKPIYLGMKRRLKLGEDPIYAQYEGKTQVNDAGEIYDILKNDPRMNGWHYGDQLEKLETEFKTGGFDAVTLKSSSPNPRTQTDEMRSLRSMGDGNTSLIGSGPSEWMGIEKSVNEETVYVSRFALLNDSNFIWISGVQESNSEQGDFVLLGMDPRNGTVKFFRERVIDDFGQHDNSFSVGENGVIENVEDYQIYVNKKGRLEAQLNADKQEMMKIFENAKGEHGESEK